MVSDLDSEVTFGNVDTSILKLESIRFTDGTNSVIALPRLINARRVESLYLEVSDSALAYRAPTPSLVTVAPPTNSDTNFSAYAFDSAVEEFIGYSIRVPQDLDPLGLISVRFTWMPLVEAAGSVVWKMYHRSIDSAESVDASMFTKTIESQVATAQSGLFISSRTYQSSDLGWFPGDQLIVHFSRDAANAADNVAVDALLLGISIEFPIKNSRYVSASFPQSQTFSSSGTWYKPYGAKFVHVYMCGGGGGGSSGSKSSGAAGGGTGGSAGYVLMGIVSADMFADEESVTVGAGGAGGAAVTANSTPGNAGTAGTASIFGPLQAAGGGIGGYIGTTPQAAPSSSFLHEFLIAGGVGSGGQGSTGSSGSAGSAGAERFPGSGGSGGAGGSNNFAGSSGGSVVVNSLVGLASGLTGGTAGSASGGAAGHGSSSPYAGFAGSGGGGGGGNNAGSGGNGGDGGNGGGGGGGGGAVNGASTVSGAGGSGGNGIVIIRVW